MRRAHPAAQRSTLRGRRRADVTTVDNCRCGSPMPTPRCLSLTPRAPARIGSMHSGHRQRAAAGPAGRPAGPIAGHSDWSGKHFRFKDDGITAIRDRDSLAIRSEAALVGVASMTYTTRFDLPGVPRARPRTRWARSSMSTAPHARLPSTEQNGERSPPTDSS